MRPAWRVTADDVDVSAALARDLLSLKVTDKPGMDSDEVEITLTDPGTLLALPRRGVRLRVAIGWTGGPLIDRGSYLVDEVRHKGPPDEITIVGRAADLTAGLRSQREASYHATTLGDVLATVAARNGLTVAVAPELAGRPLAHLDQTAESDAHLVTRLAQAHDAIGTIKDGHLLFTPRGSGTRAGGEALPAVAITRQETTEHQFSVQDREGETTGVRAAWRDYGAAETRHALAGAEGAVTALRRTWPTEAEAKAAADSALAASRRGQRDLRLRLAYGRPEIIAGQPLALIGWRPEITAVPWVVASVVHTIDGGDGFTTEIDAEEQVGKGGSGGAGGTEPGALSGGGTVDWGGTESAAATAEAAGA